MELPMQNPQALSSTRAPASIRSARLPSAAAMASTCREPGATAKLTPPASILRPFRMAATAWMSRTEELVQEADQHLLHQQAVPASSRTGYDVARRVRRGGQRLQGPHQVKVHRLRVGGVRVEHVLPHRFSRRWAEELPVIASLGKIEVVTPSSAPMLVMVARSGTERVATPAPTYSMITVPRCPWW